MTPIYSKIPVIQEERFSIGPRVLVTLEKVESYHLKCVLQRAARQLLDHFVNSLCFHRCIQVCCRRKAALFLPSHFYRPRWLDIMLDGLLEEGLIKVSEIEACRAECQLLVTEQKQLWTSTNSCLTWGTSEPSALHRLVPVFGAICTKCVLYSIL